MYSSWQLASRYLTYYFRSSNGKGHGTHSPFIFHFISQVLNNRQFFSAYATVETLRNKLLKDKTVLTIEDFGAGSTISKTSERTIATIAKNSAKPKNLMVQSDSPEKVGTWFAIPSHKKLCSFPSFPLEKDH